MGQRMQIYVQYAEEKELYGVHLQWCWGENAVIRANQVIDFIKRSVKNDKYYPFQKFEEDRKWICEAFNGDRLDRIILRSLIEINNVYGTIVRGHELDQIYGDINKEVTWQPDPFREDNNDGIVVIQVKNGVVKYCFDTLSGNGVFHPIRADIYLSNYQQLATTTADICQILIQLDKVELLTAQECATIFNKSYPVYNKKENKHE